MHQVFQVVLDFQANHEVPKIRYQNINRLSASRRFKKTTFQTRGWVPEDNLLCRLDFLGYHLFLEHHLHPYSKKREEDLEIHLKNLMCSAP